MRSVSVTLITFGCRSAPVSLVGHYSRSLAQSQRRAQSLSLAGEPNHPHNKMSFVLNTLQCCPSPRTERMHSLSLIFSIHFPLFLSLAFSLSLPFSPVMLLICGVSGNKPREMWQLLQETILAKYRIKPLLKTRSVKHSGGIDKKFFLKNAEKISFNYATDHPVLKWVITNGLEKRSMK